VDLNYPEDWPEKYDVVIDGGTAEHCFNVGQVFANILSAVRPDGGIVVHVNPLNMMNHGFWNISPTAYADFRQVVEYTKNHLYGRFQFEQPVEVTNIMAFRRMTKVDGPVVWPMQSKYR
jgi:2-polyprenyl-3-methyl-5-hydroxy-6-metoxy-1,4-benzoquinol methylase